MKGTYRRGYEGDFLCTEEAVRAMFADQRDVAADAEVLDEMGLDALNRKAVTTASMTAQEIAEELVRLLPDF